MNAQLQNLLVMVVVGWSLLVMLRRFFPALMTALQNRLAGFAARHGQPRLARWLYREPAPAGGCGSGCGGCEQACPVKSATTAPAPQPVQWRPPTSGACH